MVGFSRVAQAAGFARAIGFDMGGTSTDVSRFDGRFELEYETEKAGVRVVAPMMAIETVAAGGGSICRFDGVKLVVGPDSAGADPGPACYGRGGPLTVTDVNFYLGKILPERFPFPLDRAAVEARLAALIEHDRSGHRQATTRRSSWRRIRADRQCQHGRGDSQRSRSPRAAIRATTCWWPSAAPRRSMPAPWPASWACGRCSIIRTPACSSAYGIGLADSCGIARRASSGRTRRRRCASWRATFDALAAEARSEVLDEGVPRRADRSAPRSLDLRYRGVDALSDDP